MFKDSVSLLTKRPSILFLTAIISFVICIADNLFVLMSQSIAMFKTGSRLNDYVNIIQFLINTILVPRTAVMVILLIVVLVAATALILALLFSGGFNILNSAANGKDNKGENGFIAGVKKYFLRMLSLNLWTLCSIILFIIYALIASVPAVIIFDNALNGTVNIFAGFLLVIVTLVILFFSFAFFRQYMFFWYPSAIIYEKNHFKIAKKISNLNFWKLLSKFIAFDIIALLFNLVYLIASFSLADAQNVSGITNYILFIIDIVFKTIFIALLLCFVFSSFNACNNRFQYKKDFSD
jgi:hypothetical protein